MVPGAVELKPTDQCFSSFGLSSRCFDEVSLFGDGEPKCYTTYCELRDCGCEYPYCSDGTILTCDAASGAVLDQPPVCSRVLGANPAASNTTDSPGLCSTTGTLQPCTTLT